MVGEQGGLFGDYTSVVVAVVVVMVVVVASCDSQL
jgi:hypothetical protein